MLFLASLGVTKVFASPSTTGGDDSRVSVELSLLAWDTEISDIFYESDAGLRSLEVPGFSRSEPIAYRGSSLLSFFKEGGEGEGHVEVAQVELPVDQSKLLLIFFPLGDGNYYIHVLPDDRERFPPGITRIFNVTSYPLGIKTKSATFRLPPGEFEDVRGNGRVLHVDVVYQEENEWKRAFNNIYPLNEDMRSTIFITTSASRYLRGDPDSEDSIKVFILTDQNL